MGSDYPSIDVVSLLPPVRHHLHLSLQLSCPPFGPCSSRAAIVPSIRSSCFLAAIHDSLISLCSPKNAQTIRFPCKNFLNSSSCFCCLGLRFPCRGSGMSSHCSRLARCSPYLPKDHSNLSTACFPLESRCLWFSIKSRVTGIICSIGPVYHASSCSQ